MVASCAARVALEEKGVLYHLIEPDILRASGFRLADLLRYLAAQQPRLVEGDFALFDCDSILRYVDEAFDGPALQPADPKPRAMMVEIQGIVREYLYPAAIGKIATQRLFAPFLGSPTDTRTIDEAVQTVVTTLAATAEEKNIALTTELPPQLAVAADRAAIEQILTNLVDNAIKYTPDGGRVQVRAARFGDEGVEITVEDTGPGIPEVHQSRIFERFYRVDDARSRELGGTGLGLAIVKHLVLAHGGELGIESQEGEGTTIRFTLPAASAGQRSLPMSSAAP